MVAKILGHLTDRLEEGGKTLAIHLEKLVGLVRHVVGHLSGDRVHHNLHTVPRVPDRPTGLEIMSGGEWKPASTREALENPNDMSVVDDGIRFVGKTKD